MKCSEVAKNYLHSEDYRDDWGRIMIAVEGKAADVEKVTEKLKENWTFSNCEEEGDKEGDIVHIWCINRSEKKDFMFDYKNAKASLKSK